MENLGNSKSCQNLMESSRKFDFFVEKPEKLKENVTYVAKLSTKMYSSEHFSLELLREKFENTMEISWKSQGI